MRDHATAPATEAFLDHRNLLFTVAYDVLGSAADAEDVVQETWLRWAEVDHGRVLNQRAYLARTATRLSLNKLRGARQRKEDWVGSQLPEPLLTAPDVAEDVERADTVSAALLLVLGTLSPTERAVFVLREVFDVGYDEIAAAVGKTVDTVRQIAHRARGRVRSRRPHTAISPAQSRAMLESFRRALETGDPQCLLDALAPQIVVAPGGGSVNRLHCTASSGHSQPRRTRPYRTCAHR